MKHVLYIHNESRFTWTQLSDNGEVLAAQEINHLAAIGQTKAKDQWLILIPGQHVLLTTVNLPKTHKRELQKAIPYALEEQLISEVDKLYFAHGSYNAKNDLTVAVIDKKIFEGYLRLLKSYQILPMIMVPDFLAVPYVENRWSVVIDDDMALMRTDKQAGFSTYHNNIRLLLQLTLDKHKGDLPEKINVYNLSRFNRKNMQVANHQVAIENINHKNPLDYLQIFKEPPLNLLQNQYRPKLAMTEKKRPWLYVGISAAAWMLVFLSGKVMIDYHLKIQSTHWQQKIETDYHQVFPQSTLAADPRSSIEHELNALINNSRGGRFMSLLSRTATALHLYPKIELQSLAYQQDALTIKLVTDNLAPLEKLTRALNQQGLNVKQNQMSNDNKTISAELIIK